MPQSPNDWLKFCTDHFFTVICTLLGAIIYAQQTQISKLDERLYALQATMVTESKLNTVKQDIMAAVNSNAVQQNAQLQLLSKQIELALNNKK